MINYKKELLKIQKISGLMGTYRGFWASALRDVPGWGIYFSSYEFLK